MALPATDSFDRADTTTDSLGANWTNVYGRMRIKGNLATHDSSQGEAPSMARWSADTFADDQYSQAVMSAETHQFAYLLARLSANRNGYAIEVTLSGSGTWSIGKWVNGSWTSLAVLGTSQGYANETVRIETQGSTISGYRNGVVFGTTATDATHASGSAGIGSAYEDFDKWDNWEGGNLTGSTKPWYAYAQQ